MASKKPVLRMVLGDQLSETISSLQGLNKAHDVVMMCEVIEEATVVKHHKKKIAFIFSAMRHFAEQLRAKGVTVRYTKLDDKKNSGSFEAEVERACADLQVSKVVVTEPSEFRVLEAVRIWEKSLGVAVEILEDDRFLATKAEFTQWAEGKKQLRMEFFYREMRKKHKVLMDGDQPVGGKWNYDADNRKPPKSGLNVPAPYQAKPDEITHEVLELVQARFSNHYGELTPFHFAVTRKQALNVLKKFIQERLPLFGDYQDAMVQGEPWMYHSHIGFYLNCGLLTPFDCIKRAEEAYYEDQAPLNAVEGFIRQILGWREYVRGLYWLKMPDYEQENYLEANRALPSFFWDGNTRMNCLSQCLEETRNNAYAHHIQRLMVIGNFALLAGLDPAEVNEWYWIVYADAYQWVELPNVSGMVLFADGGVLASKPYAASGSYINKMSNYCKSCSYKVSQKSGEQACPFNYLYWYFLIKNQKALEKNPRLGMPYRTLGKMTKEKIATVTEDAEAFLSDLS